MENSEAMYGFLIPLLIASLSLTTPAVKPDDHRMDWWREARFGLFLHWGLYAVPAGEWKGETGHAEWIMNTGHIPVEQYEKFRDQFNPVKFDADAFVMMAKNAGMKYITITSKHHDGFCMFDGPGEYNIMHTPFHRDVMKELSEACKRHGMKMCWYHSIMDWHHPDYSPRREWETRSAEGADFDRYVKYLHECVTDLLTHYGPIGVMWFDGQWERTWNHKYGQELYDLCRKLQPSVIVNNRVDVGGPGAAGDYGTPEQEIPATGMPGQDWETCMTMNDHWGYNSHDHNYKSTKDIIRMLVDIASKGGNYLLNIGPTAEGTFPPEAVDRLQGIGKWMKVNGDSIYGTTASPFKSLPWGRCTVKKSVLYLHVFDWPRDGRLVVPGIGTDGAKAYLLSAPKTALNVEREGPNLVISVPTEEPSDICSTVALQVKGEPIIYETPAIKAESSIFVLPTKVDLGKVPEGLEVRYTLDGADPTSTSKLYTGPITLSESCTLRVLCFRKGKPVTAIGEMAFQRVTPLPAVDMSHHAGVVGHKTEPGLTCATYLGDWDALPDFGKLTASETRTVTKVGLPGAARENVGYRFTGYVTVPRDDVYVFALSSDDGSRLLIDGKVVIDNDGLHGPAEKQGAVALAAGAHEIVVEYFNKTGGTELSLSFGAAGAPLAPIPADALCHRR